MGESTDQARARLRASLAREPGVLVLEDVTLGEERADFVVLFQDLGAAVVHVHAGPSYYAHGRFSCDREHGGDENCNPAAYALELTYAARRRVRQGWPSRPWLHVVPAVVLTDTDHPDPLGPWAWPAALLLDDDLDDPVPLLRHALEQRRCDGDLDGTRLPVQVQQHLDGPGRDWVAPVADLLTGRTTLPEPPPRQWTPSQLHVLEATDRRRMVIGGSGTGKTAVAEEVARQWCAQGRRVAVITHSPGAAAHWRNTVRLWKERPLFVGTVRRYLYLLGREERHLVPGALSKVIAEVGGVGLNVDAMIIEEAEDQPANIWDLVGERVQDVLGTWNLHVRKVTEQRSAQVRSMQSFMLKPVNFRSSSGITALTSAGKRQSSVREFAGAIRQYLVSDPQDVEAEAWDVAWSLITDRGWLPEDIAVITTAPSNRSAVNDRLLGLYDDTHDSRWDEAWDRQRVYTCSLDEFIGMSRPVIVLAFTGIGSHHLDRAPVFIGRGIFAAQDVLCIVKTPSEKVHHGGLQQFTGLKAPRRAELYVDELYDSDTLVREELPTEGISTSATTGP